MDICVDGGWRDEDARADDGAQNVAGCAPLAHPIVHRRPQRLLFSSHRLRLHFDHRTFVRKMIHEKLK